MIYIGNLPKKIDSIDDNDIMIIEDSEDTKSVSISDLKKTIMYSSDQKIEAVKESITKEYTKSNEILKNDYNKVSNAYYALARNYEYLNTAFEELKEKFTEYITKTAQVMVGVPTIISCESTNNEVTLKWDVTLNAEGFKIYRKDIDDDGDLELIASIESPATLTYTQTELEPNKTYIYYVAAYVNTTSGEQIGALSLESRITIE